MTHRYLVLIVRQAKVGVHGYGQYTYVLIASRIGPSIDLRGLVQGHFGEPMEQRVCVDVGVVKLDLLGRNLEGLVVEHFAGEGLPLLYELGAQLHVV